MKFIKYSFVFAGLLFLTSCLKPKNDFGGMRTDKGDVVLAITEQQYLSSDLNNIGFEWSGAFANFSFTDPGSTETVRFFHVHVSQPRDVKIKGSMTVDFTMSDLDGYTLPPSGAITIAPITIPATSELSFDVPVYFSVNKTLLDPDEHYGATFTISSASQGIIAENEKSVPLIINEDADYNESKYTGVFQWVSTVTDAANLYGVDNNKKPNVQLFEDDPGELYLMDWPPFALGDATGAQRIWAFNKTNGVSTSIFAPVYHLDASGKITSITNGSGTASVTNITLDPSAPNKYVYTSNYDRVMEVKYSFDLTGAVNGVTQTRKVTVSEKWTYAKLQIGY
jgi:hypothetical protein